MEQTHSPRQRVNLTVSQSVLEEARRLNLNISQAAESGIAEAVKKAREEAWLQENAEAIAAYNTRVEKHGTLLTPIWELRERGEI